MWNEFSISVPTIDLGPLGTVGGGSIGTTDIGYLPTDRASATNTGFKRFAEGGVVTGPTYALIGEDARTTPEIVAPEDTIRRIVREESGAGRTMIRNVIQIDKRTLIEVVTEGLRGREMALR